MKPTIYIYIYICIYIYIYDIYPTNRNDNKNKKRSVMKPRSVCCLWNCLVAAHCVWHSRDQAFALVETIESLPRHHCRLDLPREVGPRCAAVPNSHPSSTASRPPCEGGAEDYVPPVPNRQHGCLVVPSLAEALGGDCASLLASLYKRFARHRVFGRALLSIAISTR